MVALAAGRAAAGKARPWRCLDCGMTLADKVLVKGGYAHLVLNLAGVRRVETVGHEVRHTCRRCGAVKVWHTSAPTEQTA